MADEGEIGGLKPGKAVVKGSAMGASSSTACQQRPGHQPHQQILLPGDGADADAGPGNEAGVEAPPASGKSKSKKLTLIPLVFLIYFEVSGGPFGEEPAVQAAGPLLAILGFIIFPVIWSIPEALITAELSTAYPGNGGYVIWATEAFGPFWGFLMGWWKWLSGAINNAAYPVLCVDYLKLVFPTFSAGLSRNLAISLFNVCFAFLNYTGLTIVGWTAVILAALSLAPFILLLFFAIPKIRPSRWLSNGQSKSRDWSLYLNTIFWNLNYWDNASTVAGEVEHPQKTYPKALLLAGLLTCSSYLIPLLAGIGALELEQDKWSDGYLADVAGMIAGKWLKFWVEAGAVMSAVGLFEAQLSSCSFQLLGMAELGHLPAFLAKRSEWFDTPSWGILISTIVTIALSYTNFTNIVSSANFLYSCGMLLEFSTFVWLRRKCPRLRRPFKVPLGIPGLVCMCIIPSAFVVVVMVLAGKIVFIISGGFSLLGIAGYFAIKLCKAKKWVSFIKVPEECEDDATATLEGRDEEEKNTYYRDASNRQFLS
ncbi:putative polyamine transporter [Nymphaea thermarum]|nr:putative polyamine transporter [Nymphaea thermarum]